ncbi:MAG: PorT family protein [Bacteroidota bacterium]|nr:PorT family protein [Bacteroidota bacterium]
MKKVVFVALLCFWIIQAGYAQKSFGFKAGLNVSTADVDRGLPLGPQSRLGFHLGIWKEFSLSSKFFLRPELVYSLKGYRFSDSSFAPGYVPTRRKETMSYHYLTLPILVGFRPKQKLGIYAGPEISLLGPLRSKSDGGNSNLRLFTNDYKNVDLGLTAGLYYKLTPRLNADLRYTYGFSTILNWDILGAQGEYEYTIKESHNKVLQFGLSYMLRRRE